MKCIFERMILMNILERIACCATVADKKDLWCNADMRETMIEYATKYNDDIPTLEDMQD